MQGSWEAFAAVCVAVLLFGSNLIPVKKYFASDGLFFQWIMCSGIWFVGLIVHLARACPQFEPVAMLGGMFWALGNMLAVPVIQLIGIGLSILLWGSSTLIVGWAR